MLKIKKGDLVVILAGKENGKTGEVLECFPKENKVTVKGLNMIVKHNKPKSAQDKGGIVKKEGKIDISNVMLVCPNCNKATRVKMDLSGEKKARMCSKCGAILDGKKVSKPKAESKKTEAKKADDKETKSTAKKTVAKKSEAQSAKPKKTTTKAKSAQKVEKAK